jgi:soluble lytic murein transglycosylase-like protein
MLTEMLPGALALAATLASAPIDECAARMEAHYALPAGIVAKIIAAESGGNPRAINRANSNGTVDYGLMQINSSHLPVLRGFGVDENVLLDSPCINVAVGGAVLAHGLRVSDGHLIHALSRYNTGRVSEIGLRYAARVIGGSTAAPVVAAPNPHRASLIVAGKSSGFDVMSGDFAPVWR